MIPGNRFGLLGGYTGSDMGNVMQLAMNYGFAKDGPTAVRLAMEAGLDQNMGGQYSTFTKQIVESGELSKETLNRAVGNILRKKFATGLFDAEPIDPAGISVIDSAKHRALALEVQFLLFSTVFSGFRLSLICFDRRRGRGSYC